MNDVFLLTHLRFHVKTCTKISCMGDLDYQTLTVAGTEKSYDLQLKSKLQILSA